MSISVDAAFRNSKLDKCDFVVDLVATNPTAKWSGGKGTQPVSSGRAYFTVKCKIEKGSNGVCRFGWSQKSSCILGGVDFRSMGYGSTGKKSHGNIFVTYGREFFDGDTIGCYFDFDAKVVAFFTNGEFEGYAFTQDDFRPSSKMFEGTYFPAYCLKNATAEFNFGATQFAYPPSDFPFVVTAPPELGRACLTETPLDWKYSRLVVDEGVNVKNMLASCSTSIGDKNSWRGGVGKSSVYSKTAYFEATVTFHGKEGRCRLGWSKRRANFLLGMDDQGMCYGSDGTIRHYGMSKDWGGTTTINGFVIGCFLDLENKLISFSSNNDFLGVAFVDSMMEPNLKMFESPLFPAFCLRNAAVELNFGATDFQYENVTLTQSYYEYLPKARVIDWQYGFHRATEFDEEKELFNTQLHYAVYHDNYYLVRQLIMRGADVELRNSNDRTALGSAVNTRRHDIALLLLKEGKADILARVEGARILDLMAGVWIEEELRALIDVSNWPIDEDFNNFYNYVDHFQRASNGSRPPPRRNFDVEIMEDGSVEAIWKRDQSNEVRCLVEIILIDSTDTSFHLPVPPNAVRGARPVEAALNVFAIERLICSIADYL